MKIHAYLSCLFSLLFFIAFICFGWIAYSNTKAALLSNTRFHLEATANLQQSHLQDIVKQHQILLHSLTSRIQLRRSVGQYFAHKTPAEHLLIQQIFAAVEKEVKTVEEISVLDLEGNTLVSTRQNLSETSFANQLVFKQGLKENRVDYLRLQNGQLQLLFSGPLLDSDNKTPLGVLLIIAKSTQLQSLVQGYQTFGKTSELMLLSKISDDSAAGSPNYNICAITSLRFDNHLPLSILEKKPGSPAEFALNNQNGGFLPGSIDYRGVKVMAATRYIPDLKWGMVVKIDESEVLKLLWQMLQWLLLAGLVFFCIIFAAGFFTARLLVKPLSQLAEKAQLIAKGEYHQTLQMRIPALNYRELRVLDDGIKDTVRELRNRTIALEQANRELRRLATLDGLTRVPNRRAFDEYFSRAWRQMLREQKPISLIMCDVDKFKVYNDTYGHQAGDECLKKVAIVLTDNLKRPADRVARYGGEEFVIVLPNTSVVGAMHVAHQIQETLQKLKIPHQKSVAPFVTLSMGIANIVPKATHHARSLLKSADEALYEAKERGRNRVVLYGESN